MIRLDAKYSPIFIIYTSNSNGDFIIVILRIFLDILLQLAIIDYMVSVDSGTGILPVMVFPTGSA